MRIGEQALDLDHGSPVPLGNNLSYARSYDRGQEIPRTIDRIPGEGEIGLRQVGAGVLWSLSIYERGNDKGPFTLE